jgi:hypothetical protein
MRVPVGLQIGFSGRDHPDARAGRLVRAAGWFAPWPRAAPVCDRRRSPAAPARSSFACGSLPSKPIRPPSSAKTDAKEAASPSLQPAIKVEYRSATRMSSVAPVVFAPSMLTVTAPPWSRRVMPRLPAPQNVVAVARVEPSGQKRRVAQPLSWAPQSSSENSASSSPDADRVYAYVNDWTLEELRLSMPV